MTEKTDLELEIEKADAAVNIEDIHISEEEGSYIITVEDESETYKALVNLGKTIKEDATDLEAFELAMNEILNNYMKNTDVEKL